MVPQINVTSRVSPSLLSVWSGVSDAMQPVASAASSDDVVADAPVTETHDVVDVVAPDWPAATLCGATIPGATGRAAEAQDEPTASHAARTARMRILRCWGIRGGFRRPSGGLPGGKSGPWRCGAELAYIVSTSDARQWITVAYLVTRSKLHQRFSDFEPILSWAAKWYRPGARVAPSFTGT